jgi:hypothetical protein
MSTLLYTSAQETPVTKESEYTLWPTELIILASVKYLGFCFSYQ